MVIKKYNITYIANMKTYKVTVTLDDSIQIIDEKSHSQIKTSDAHEALLFINKLHINKELKHDLAKLIDDSLVQEQHDRINLLLLEMENSLDHADDVFEQKYFELRNRFAKMTSSTNKDIKNFESFEEEIDQN